MKTIKQTYIIHAPVASVWEALVNPKIIFKWGAGPARMDDRVGTKFSLWGGDIHGTNTAVVKMKKLKQDWYGGDWPKPSNVTFTLIQKEHTTTVELLHNNIPDNEYNEINDGWGRYYLGPLKELVEKDTA